MYFALFVLLFLARTASLDLVCGPYHNCVFQRGQEAMKCWGGNHYHKLGLDLTTNRGDNPNEMGADLPFLHIGTDFIVDDMMLGRDHSCAMSDDRAAKCFGRNAYSQLGFNGTTTTGDALPFLEFGVDFNLSKIAAGGAHTCALSTHAQLKCFGDNEFAQCGAGTTASPISGPPSAIDAIDLGTDFTPVNLDIFHHHVCVLSQQGTAKCFGQNDYAQLGYGDKTNRGFTPESMGDGLPIVDLGSNFMVAAVATGGRHSCALSTVKTVKCWGCVDTGVGAENNGQCGTPHNGETGDNLPVLDLAAEFVPMQLALGQYHTCILSESLTLICFGDNSRGQLGTGNTNDIATPSTLTGIALGSDFVPRQVDAGVWHTCAVSTSDAVKCWGQNDIGQLGLGHTMTVGNEPNEMGDNLPIVDVCLDCTAAPTTVSPTTAEPTTTAPTVVPTVAPTTAGPTTTAPTTNEPSAAPTATAAQLPADIYNVTIVTDDLPCQEIKDVIVPAVYNVTARAIIINVTTECDDDETIPVELLVAMPPSSELNNETALYVLFVTVIKDVYEDDEVDVVIIVTRIVPLTPTDSEEPPLIAFEWWIVIGAGGFCLMMGVCVMIALILRRQPAPSVVNDYRGAQITMVGTAAVGTQQSEEKQEENRDADDDEKADEALFANADAIVVKNALVLSVGMSEYSTLVNLPGVISDVDNHRNLWKNVFNYRVIPDKNDLDAEKWFQKKYWTYHEIEEFIQEKRLEIFDHNDNLLYDALIITINGHGDNNGILPSDYDANDKDNNVHVNYSQLQIPVDGNWKAAISTIPRIFIVDACRGYRDDAAVRPDDSEASQERGNPGTVHKDALTCMLYGNSPGFKVKEHAARGGKFSQCLIRELERTKGASTSPPLSIITSRTSKALQLMSDKEQTCWLEGDPLCNNVVFVRNAQN